MSVFSSVDQKQTPAVDNNMDLSTQQIHRLANQNNLIFSLDDEQYGIPLSLVKEVIGVVKITPIPHVPTFFKGLINLRGRIISVIDLRVKLGFCEKAFEPKKTAIIISNINDLTIGTIVDDVNEVIGFSEKQLELTEDIRNEVARNYISAVAKGTDNRLILLLDIEKVLKPDELTMIREKQIIQNNQTRIDNE